MPIVKPASELQRNIASIYDICAKTGEPVYITRNGEAALVVMDAHAFDERLDLQQRVLAHEMKTLSALEEGRQQIANGQARSWSDTRAELDL